MLPVLALLVVCVVHSDLVIGHSHLCAETLTTSCTEKWKSFDARQFLYCPRTTGNQAFLYGRCNGCVPGMHGQFRKVGNFTYDDGLCQKANLFTDLNDPTGDGIHTYCAIFVDDEPASNPSVDYAISKINKDQQDVNVTIRGTATECGHRLDDYVGTYANRVEFANESLSATFMALMGNDTLDQLCYESKTADTAICTVGQGSSRTATVNGTEQNTAVVKKMCDQNCTVMGNPPDLNVIFRRLSAGTGNSRGVFLNRATCDMAFDYNSDEYCDRVYHCPTCVSLTDMSGSSNYSRGNDSTIVLVNGFYYETGFCLKIFGTYTSPDDGMVYGNASMVTFNTTDANLYCPRRYLLTSVPKLRGLPLLDYLSLKSAASPLAVTAILSLVLAALGSIVVQ